MRDLEIKRRYIRNMHTRLLFFDVVSTLVINLMSVKECNFFISERLWTVTGLKNLYIWAFFSDFTWSEKDFWETTVNGWNINSRGEHISVIIIAKFAIKCDGQKYGTHILKVLRFWDYIQDHFVHLLITNNYTQGWVISWPILDFVW